MPIASIGVVLTVTPQDDIQIVRGKGDHEFVGDRSSFTVKVSEVLRENGVIIGVVGRVIEGHARYQGKIATLTTRIDDSHWESDMHSGANFKVGSRMARRISAFPHNHPEGTEIDYPFIVRYGGVDAEF